MTQRPKYDHPTAEDFFDCFGGIFISEALAQGVEVLHVAYRRYRDDPASILCTICGHVSFGTLGVCVVSLL